MSLDSRKLIDQLEIVKSLITSGFTLQEALRLSPQRSDIQVSLELAEDWRTLRRQILCGEIQGGSTLSAFIERLELELDIEESYKKSVAMPIAQSVVCGGLFLTTLGLRFFLFESALGSPDLLALCLILLASLAQFKIYKHFTREAWVIDWVKILAAFENRIRHGKTAQHAMQEIGASKTNTAIPRVLLTAHPTIDASIKRGPLESAAGDAWVLIWQAHARGLSLGAITKSQRDRLVKKILAHHTQSATQASFISLIPLYFLFLPACLIVILGPLLNQLLKI